MISKEWFIVNTENQQIVNCVTSTEKPSLDLWESDNLVVVEHPSQEQLDNYEYYSKRP